MLKVTDDAAALIRALPHRPHGAGASRVRIDVDPVHSSLSMSAASVPAATDSVVANAEVQVFLSPAASRRLRASTLHAEISPTRSLFFLAATE